MCHRGEGGTCHREEKEGHVTVKRRRDVSYRSTYARHLCRSSSSEPRDQWGEQGSWFIILPSTPAPPSLSWVFQPQHP